MLKSIGWNLSSTSVTKTKDDIAKDSKALFIVKKLVKGSLNKFLFKNKNKAVNNGRKIGSKKSNSKLSS